MPRPQSLATAIACGALFALPCAHAQVSFQTSQAAFDAVSTTTLQATFDAAVEGYRTGAYTEGRVSFIDLSHRLYIAGPGGAVVSAGLFAVPLTSKVLVSDFYENIKMTFSGAAPTAVGFNTITNRDTAKPSVLVYDVANNLIGTYTLTQAAATTGFVGITSTVGIGAVRWLAGNTGESQHTAIDNIYIDAGVSAVPEPESAALLMAGLGVLGLMVRRLQL